MLRRYCRIGALAIAVLAATLSAPAQNRVDEPTPWPKGLQDVVPNDPARAALATLLSQTPDANATSTYLGILRRAEKAAQETGVVIRDARKRRTFEPGAPGRFAFAVAVSNTLDRYNDAIDEVTAALDGSKGDPLRLLVVGRAAIALADTLPSRADLAPIERDSGTGKQVDLVTKKMHKLLAQVLAAGMELREATLAKEVSPAYKAAADRRRAARGYAKAALALIAEVECRQASECANDELLNGYRKWLACNELGRTPRGIDELPNPGANSDDKTVSRFRIADVLALVPWPFALAESLKLGEVEMRWELAGIDPVDTKPETTSVFPRINVSTWFRVQGEGKAHLPIWTTRLRHQPVDRLTLNDPVGYRARLKEYLNKVAQAQASLADNPDLAAMRKAISESPAKDFLATFDALAGQNLGENPLTYALVGRTWGETRLNHDLYWVVRLSAMRTQAPRSSAPAPPPKQEPSPPVPAPPPKPVDYTAEWGKELNFGSRAVADVDIDMDVSAIIGLIRERLESRLESLSGRVTGELFNTEGDGLGVSLAGAEKTLIEADPDGRAGMAPIPGDMFRRIAAYVEHSHDALKDHLWENLPVWLPAHSRYQHPNASLAAKLPTALPTMSLVAEVIRVWNTAEDEADRCVDGTTLGWRQFLKTLADLMRTPLASSVTVSPDNSCRWTPNRF